MTRATERQVQGGLQVPELCERLAMTQQEFATCLGFSVVSMSRWTSGRSRPNDLSRGIIGLVVRALGVTDAPVVAATLRGLVGADPTDRLVALVDLGATTTRGVPRHRGGEP